MSEPKLVTLPAFRVAGLPMTTTNAAEMNPATAKIKDHWQRFFAEGHHERIVKASDKLLGVYTNYESDHNGEYTLLPAFETPADVEPTEGLIAVEIPEQDYLVFRAEGEMPMIVFGTWGKVMMHMQEEERFERAYTADFELYPDEHSVEIHIAVKRKG